MEAAVMLTDVKVLSYGQHQQHFTVCSWLTRYFITLCSYPLPVITDNLDLLFFILFSLISKYIMLLQRLFLVITKEAENCLKLFSYGLCCNLVICFSANMSNLGVGFGLVCWSFQIITSICECVKNMLLWNYTGMPLISRDMRRFAVAFWTPSVTSLTPSTGLLNWRPQSQKWYVLLMLIDRWSLCQFCNF